MSGLPHRAWAALISAALARALLLCAASLLLWGAAPALWGWVPTTVASDSMAPGIRAGDAVISMPVDPATITVGQILLVKDPDHAGRERLHRFVGTTADGALILKGDANESEDSTPVDPSAVVGVGVLRIPWVGLPGLWLRTGAIIQLAVLAAGLIALGVLSRIDRRFWLPKRERTTAGRSSLGAAAVIGVVTLVASGLYSVAPEARAAFTAANGSQSSSLTALAAYPCLSPAPAVASYLSYPFGETTGTTTADSSGNARTGTLVAAPTRVAGSCALNSSPALTLNGTTQHVTTPTSLAGPNVFTISIWFKTTTTTGGKLIGFGNSQAGVSTSFDRHLYMTNAGRLVFGVRPSARVTITSPLAYNNGAWHQAVATLSPAGMSLYVDGALVASGTGATTGGAYTGFWRIGYDTMASWTSAPTSRFFAGTIDSPTVYTTALTPAQVSASYTAGH